MSSPLLFHLQSAPLCDLAARLSCVGSTLAATALVYETLADLQKSLFKISLRAANKPDELYTGGLYASSQMETKEVEISCRSFTRLHVFAFVPWLPSVFRFI